jgi:hypothetical protein
MNRFWGLGRSLLALSSTAYYAIYLEENLP